MNLFEAFLIYSVIVEGKDMTVMDNQHESGKIIPGCIFLRVSESTEYVTNSFLTYTDHMQTLT